MSDARRTPKDIRRENRSSWMSDVITSGNVAKSVMAIVLLFIFVGGLFLRADSLQTKELSKTQHDEERRQRVDSDKKLAEAVEETEKKIAPIIEQMKETGKDVKFLKCYLTKGKKARDKCGFE